MDNKKIKDLNLGSNFGSVLRILEAQLKDLDNVCDRQVLTRTLDKSLVDAELAKIDDFITNNPVIQDAMIEGSEDVKAVIAAVNYEISGRMSDFKANFRDDADKDQIDQINKDFEEKSQINTKQKDLEEFESEAFSIKNTQEREDEEKSDAENLAERVKNAKAFKAMKGKDPSITAISLNDDIIYVVKESNDIDNKIKRIENLKEPEEYKDKVDELKRVIHMASIGRIKFNKKMLNGVKNDLAVLNKLRGRCGSPELDDLISKIQVFTAKTPFNPVTDVKTLDTILQNDSYNNIDWGKSVDNTKQKLNEEIKADLLNVLKNHNIFKVFPTTDPQNDIKAWLTTLQSANPNVEFVKNQMDKFIERTDLPVMINNMERDSADIVGLENKQLKAEKRANKLNDVNKRQKTTTAKLFGQELNAKDRTTGEIVDFAKLSDTQKDDAIEELYNKVRNGDMTQLDVEYRKPSLFARIMYKIKPSNWFTGKGLADQRKEDWVIKEISEHIDKIKDDATNEKSWTLTPEQEKEIADKQNKIVKDAKTQARTDIILNGKTSKEAKNNADQEIIDKQKEADDELTI